MPRVFKATEIENEDKEIKRDYLDSHMPHVFCPDTVKRGEKFEVKVKLGEEYPHPDEHDHFISVIQLWNRETLLAEARYTAGVFGCTISCGGRFLYCSTRSINESFGNVGMHKTWTVAE